MRKSVFVKALLACLLVALLGTVACAASKGFTAQQLKLMSTFLSNVTEQGFYDFDVKKSDDDDTLHLGGDPSNPDLIRFGIRHNYINNFKSRIRKCTKKNCEYGSLTIEGKFVAESVKKYFDIDLKNASVEDSDPPYHFDGKFYHFEGADGEAVYYAEVKEATKEGDIVRMTGEIYNAEDKDDRPYAFEATAKPYKWNGKDTWVILSMMTKANLPEKEVARMMARTKGTWRFHGEDDTAYIVMDGKGNYEAYYASGALESAGTLELQEEYEGVYVYSMRDKSGKSLDAFFMDSDTQLHFGNEEGQEYMKDKD